MKKKLRTKITFVFLTLLTLFSCTKNFNETPGTIDDSGALKSGKGIIDLSFTMTTSKDFQLPKTELSDLDMSTMNPSNDKQQVRMQLLESGEMIISIEELDFKEKIKIPHKLLPDKTKKIKKTEIAGNTITMYDEDGKKVNSSHIDMPNQIELVKKVKEMGSKFTAEDINNTISTMQGQKFVANLEDFIAKAPANGIKVVKHGDDFVTLRMPLNKDDPKQNKETVLLVDKKLNKIVGNCIYDGNNELLQSTFYGYDKGKVKSLNAIKMNQKVKLPSGQQAVMEINTQIDDLKFSLNK